PAVKYFSMYFSFCNFVVKPRISVNIKRPLCPRRSDRYPLREVNTTLNCNGLFIVLGNKYSFNSWHLLTNDDSSYPSNRTKILYFLSHLLSVIKLLKRS